MNTNKIIKEYLPKPMSGAVLNDLAAMEVNLANACLSGGVLSEGLLRVNSSGGKRLRPLLARICWQAGGRQGEIVPLMTMLEMMHTTSLIHDDFVDGATLRRGAATISAAEGWKCAMRSGDYLLAKAMEYLKVYRGTGINEVLSDVAQEMCLGELEQHEGLFRAEGMTTDVYYSRIGRKTALLMSASCRTGAMAGGAPEELAQALADYGLYLGNAFQIRDDLLDWEVSAKTGKPRLQDLRSGVITLPCIYAL